MPSVVTGIGWWCTRERLSCYSFHGLWTILSLSLFSLIFDDIMLIKNYEKTVKFSQSLKQEKKHYEIKLKLTIPKNNLIRLAVENSIGRSEPSDAKYLSIKPTNSSQPEQIKLNTILALIVVLIVVFLIVSLFIAILFKLRRDFNKKSQLNHESQCKLNDTIESRSVQQIEIVSTNLNTGATHLPFMDNLVSKMSDKRIRTGLNSPRSHSGPNFGIFSRITSLKRKDTKQAKKQQCLDSTISDINLIDKHINLPITLKNLTSQLELMSDNFAKTYTKESLFKRFTEDLESLDKDMHFEFCEIKNPINKSFHDSLKIQNERKSRYKHLSLVSGRPDSDFINASYIEGHSQSKRFIAAQGPTKDTTEDFLRMVVEKNVKIIVMLTKIYEGDPPILKCWPYWNDKNLIKFGLSSCEVKSIENKLFYEKRKLKIKCKDLHCLVDHYYYKEWPDRSSPLESQSIIELIDSLVRNLESNPILVHCSAGIGRTGTFVALFNLMDMMKDSNTVSPNKIVYEMRRQRAYSVQNWEQYKFIHQALLEWFIFSNSTLNAAEKDSVKSILSNKNGSENEFLEILNLKDSFKIKTYSFMNIIKCSSIHELIRRDIEYNPSNFKENLDNYKLLDILFLKTPPFNINFVLSSEPSSKNINLYLTAIFRLKPEIIVSISPKENSYFSVLNETSIDKSLVCGIVVLCQEVKSNEFFKEFELELIDTKSKNKSIKIRYFTTEKLWTNENVSCMNNSSSTHVPDNLFQQNETKINEIDTDQEENGSKNSGIFPVSNNEYIIKLFDALGEYMDTKSDFLTSSSTGPVRYYIFKRFYLLALTFYYILLLIVSADKNFVPPKFRICYLILIIF
ncbi:receptor-type tyrosine- phosphatase epsilon isoform X3 [Brachionus plicatilis]|uniref:Receptor-type tyrosine-phosphatase epsilon isoform X3 n=1 Tax=Brachionus plicatilis TaxID=10195 RepID=A0A3M7SMU0_BRAPC|nr:receptor-type tyrosine- phosphatase epsilon isoform X3 [Brachionus plicatilis]